MILSSTSSLIKGKSLLCQTGRKHLILPVILLKQSIVTFVLYQEHSY